MNIFQNRNLLIVTKHGKEEVLKPVLERALDVKCLLSDAFDTDIFGTFSGEIERKENALTTIRNKCLGAMQYHNVDLAVASEGSFGPHPAAFFATADDELLILIDKKNDLEIIGRKLSLETNFASKECTNLSSFLLFLKQIQFPSHKVILKDKNSFEIYKDIDTEEEAIRIFEILVAKHGLVFAETDMRAMNNPTRMKVIHEAAENLIEKMKSLCPECQHPGFSVTSSVAGLPCSSCNFPTKSILYQTLSCSKCNNTEKNYFPRKVHVEDAMYCDNCNP
jgi:hypothetical protein